MAEVRFEQVCKRYPGATILENFNLTIADKEFLVLVGPSGCGKSTTLRLIAGLEEISEGKLFIKERLINDIAPGDRNVAMVFQDYALYPHLSVSENMGFALKMRKVPRQQIQQKVMDAAKILDLEPLLQRKPKELSGGQRQRVAIGRAIVRDPQVFLFDEPLSNLDAKLRVQMRVEISKLHKRLNTTIVYVTHDQIEAMTLADRIVVMKDGFIQQIGSPMELYDKPTNAFVGGFIGSPVMNQVPGKIHQKNGTLSVHGDGFQMELNAFQAQAVQKQDKAGVLLGIRPQDLVLVDADDTPSFQAQIDVIEPVGSESYLYFSLCEKQWVARSDGLPLIREGQTAYFKVDSQKLHIFTDDGTARVA